MNKNLIRFFVISLCILALGYSSVSAQKRRTTTRTRTPAATATATSKAGVKAGAEKVSLQIKNSTKFLYVLGGVARAIEEVDKEIAAKKMSANASSLNNANKQKVLQSLQNLRAGLVQLEVDFRVKPELKPFLFKIQGISDMSARAEDLAVAGQFTESGKVLLLVVEKLCDTLSAMP